MTSESIQKAWAKYVDAMSQAAVVEIALKKTTELFSARTDCVEAAPLPAAGDTGMDQGIT